MFAINGGWFVLGCGYFSKDIYVDSTNDLQYLTANCFTLAVTSGFEL